MSEPGELAGLAELAEAAAVRAAVAGRDPVSNLELARTRRTAEKRERAVALRMSGATFAEIAVALGTRADVAAQMVDDALVLPSRVKIERMRELENRRLDRAQQAIWGQVEAGDLKAGELFLRISARRARMNGLDEATKVAFTVGVRQEMEAALAELQTVVLGQVVSVVDDTR